MVHIVHLTSAHPRNDTRVFHKMCCSLAEAGHRVHLVVADGLGDELLKKVDIIDVGRPKSRAYRMIQSAARVAEAGAALCPDIFHLHDPELIRFIPKLSQIGAKVVFDSHEDVGKQILAKHYLPKVARSGISSVYSVFERRLLLRADLVLAATPTIAAKFVNLGFYAKTINNFPIVDELKPLDVTSRPKKPIACYVGGVSAVRGALAMADAAALLPAGRSIIVAGPIFPASLEREIGQRSNGQLSLLGHIDRLNVRRLLNESIAGLVTLMPTPNHLESQPIKMFEYMSAGLPVIASDFPLWRSLIEGVDCGLLVNPNDPQSIAQAINVLLDDPARAEALGRNGQAAVISRYNWETEFTALDGAYAELLSR